VRQSPEFILEAGLADGEAGLFVDLVEGSAI
jgi:hypothetical protein